MSVPKVGVDGYIRGSGLGIHIDPNRKPLWQSKGNPPPKAFANMQEFAGYLYITYGAAKSSVMSMITLPEYHNIMEDRPDASEDDIPSPTTPHITSRQPIHEGEEYLVMVGKEHLKLGAKMVQLPSSNEKVLCVGLQDYTVEAILKAEANNTIPVNLDNSRELISELGILYEKLVVSGTEKQGTE